MENINKSKYILDNEPVKAVFEADDSIVMAAYKNNVVKPVSIEIGNYSLSKDANGRNLYVGEKDPSGKPYNEAYSNDAFAGAIFGLFKTREEAQNATVTEDINDVSVERKAYDAGAIAVMTSDANGLCGTVDNLKWKDDGYYIRELKAPTSGSYQLNKGILQISCDGNTQNTEHFWTAVDADKIFVHFDVDETPNYYYVKIEKTSNDESVLNDTSKYNLEGIHFALYKTYEEAQRTTIDNVGTPLYNLYTQKNIYEDGSVHYEAISGLTGPGVFWVREFIKEDSNSNGFQTLSSPVRVEAHKANGSPQYETTPIVPENSAPIFDVRTGRLKYKTAEDIDKERGEASKTLEKTITSSTRFSKSTNRSVPPKRYDEISGICWK